MRPLEDRPHALHFPADEGRTEQNHVKDCDINIIMKRALRGQGSEYIRDDPGSYGDATSVDFYQAHVLVAESKTMFEELPSKIRSRFENDPGQFLEFIKDEKNLPEAIELGLVKKPLPEPEPEPIIAVSPTTEPVSTVLPTTEPVPAVPPTAAPAA